MIFYFTGTGNCLQVARELVKAEGETSDPISIPQELQKEGELAYSDEAIGIVYPIYGHLMPVMVREFLERATFDTPYFYFICTYGCRHANAVELCQQDARSCGIEPSYITTLLMVDNWLPNFDMDVQRSLIPEKRIDENLSRIVSDITARKRWIDPVTDADRAAHEEFLSRGIAFEPAALRDFLTIDTDACIGCETCVRVCPAGCIRINEEGIAQRDALAGKGCNACLACIHACPSFAIELPMGEVNPKARYLNDAVTLQDLMKANNTF